MLGGCHSAAAARKCLFFCSVFSFCMLDVPAVGAAVGLNVGAAVGSNVGAAVGSNVGAAVGPVGLGVGVAVGGGE